MIRRLLAKLAGHWCETHQRGFDSDFCPECLRSRLARAERIDRSPEWTKAEGTWPLVMTAPADPVPARGAEESK